jgi:hypothetical protein
MAATKPDKFAVDLFGEQIVSGQALEMWFLRTSVQIFQISSIVDLIFKALTHLFGQYFPIRFVKLVLC